MDSLGLSPEEGLTRLPGKIIGGQAERFGFGFDAEFHLFFACIIAIADVGKMGHCYQQLLDLFRRFRQFVKIRSGQPHLHRRAAAIALGLAGIANLFDSRQVANLLPPLPFQLLHRNNVIPLLPRQKRHHDLPARLALGVGNDSANDTIAAPGIKIFFLQSHRARADLFQIPNRRFGGSSIRHRERNLHHVALNRGHENEAHPITRDRRA